MSKINELVEYKSAEFQVNILYDEQLQEGSFCRRFGACSSVGLKALEIRILSDKGQSGCYLSLLHLWLGV